MRLAVVMVVALAVTTLVLDIIVLGTK